MTSKLHEALNSSYDEVIFHTFNKLYASTCGQKFFPNFSSSNLEENILQVETSPQEDKVRPLFIVTENKYWQADNEYYSNKPKDFKTHYLLVPRLFQYLLNEMNELAKPNVKKYQDHPELRAPNRFLYFKQELFSGGTPSHKETRYYFNFCHNCLTHPNYDLSVLHSTTQHTPPSDKFPMFPYFDTQAHWDFFLRIEKGVIAKRIAQSRKDYFSEYFAKALDSLPPKF